MGYDVSNTQRSDEGEHTARFKVLLEPEARNAAAEDAVIARLRSRLADIPDVSARVTRPVLFSSRTPIEVEVHGEDGSPRRDGRGLYASALLAAYPELPVEEGERLRDARLRENFVERLYAYRRRREGALAKPSTRDAARSRT